MPLYKGTRVAGTDAENLPMAAYSAATALMTLQQSGTPIALQLHLRFYHRGNPGLARSTRMVLYLQDRVVKSRMIMSRKLRFLWHIGFHGYLK